VLTMTAHMPALPRLSFFIPLLIQTFPITHAVPLSDPTCYAPVIDYVKNMAVDVQQDEHDYCVLLLITDGGIEGV
jgi:hypothetical protein